ncbi:MAG TPA: GNAT family N-acetyltransferase [Candidatus Baltobacteraceae bacterium]|nr:GNAT family N-acetyltransferase [Candidatus Baltobacteraceae bacterium]
MDSLNAVDRARWEELARGYQTFYERTLPEETYEATWRQLMDATEIFALGARFDGELAGIVHYLFHRRVWFGRACYLQDLFVDERVRGFGIGRALIDAVAEEARKRGCSRVYWHTRENNAAARLLYDSLATFDGFIRYDRAI